MKITIGLRLFASVLLAILAVAASAIVLMRQDVLRSFSEYAAEIELDRLHALSASLAHRYQDGNDWAFLPGDANARRRWIARELERLQNARVQPAHPVPPAPEAPAPPAAIAAAAIAPPSAELPPLPLPAMPAPPPPPAPPIPGAEVDTLGLPERVTLLDAAGGYLAGRPPGREARALRPIEAAGRTVGYLAVARVMRPSDALAAAFLDQLRSSLWTIAAASVALSALAAVLLAAHFRKPILRLAGGARSLAEGRFDTRLPVERSDELGALAQSFNELAQRLDAMEASRRQWVADTSHELRTPLAVLRAQLEAIEDGVRPADAAGVASMLRQVLALNKLIDQLYALAKADVGVLDCQRQPLDLWELATGVAASFEERLHGAGLVLETGPAPHAARVLADPDHLRQVFGNLFENAARYTAAGGRVRLHGLVHDGAVAIVIDDSAPGVPDEALPRLGERFYRPDAARSRAQGGAGLGLALCRRILDAHGSRIAFAHSPLGGLRATVIFPLLPA